MKNKSQEISRNLWTFYLKHINLLLCLVIVNSSKQQLVSQMGFLRDTFQNTMTKHIIIWLAFLYKMGGLPMSKQRYVNTKFWDDNYIIDLDPIEKLLFLYLLTNPLTDICGVYEVSLKRIGFDTGIDKEMVYKILDRFKKDNKIVYDNGWVAIKNFIKHQALNPKIEKGIEVGLDKAPKPLKEWIKKTTKAYNSLSKPLNYSNTNTNTNSNINSNTNDNTDTLLNDFNSLWQEYPKRLGRKKALSHFKASIKNGSSVDNIRLAMTNYIAHIKIKKIENDFIQHGSTWFNNWEEWLDYKEPAKADPMETVNKQYEERQEELAERAKKKEEE